MEKKILMVEESDKVREAVCRALSCAGYSVLAVKEGGDALAVLNRDEPLSLVIIGSSVSSTGRVTLARAVRKHPWRSSTPVLFMTPEYLHGMSNEWVRAGATAWIEEPFTKEEFLRTVYTTAA